MGTGRQAWDEWPYRGRAQAGTLQESGAGVHPAPREEWGRLALHLLPPAQSTAECPESDTVTEEGSQCDRPPLRRPCGRLQEHLQEDGPAQLC